MELLSGTPFSQAITNNDEGIVVDDDPQNADFASKFIAAMANHRFWAREATL